LQEFRSCRMDNRHLDGAPHFPLRKEFWAFTVDSAPAFTVHLYQQVFSY
jgi:hypothetical protein